MVEVYIREPDGSLVARFEPGEDPVVQYYFDGLGSTVMLTDGLSAVTDRYDYDAWGNEYPITASTVDNPYRYVGELGYYTHWMDPSLSDLLHLGVRFYEPGVRRFGQVDPAEDGVNWYLYAADQPVLLTDPSGELSVLVWAPCAYAAACGVTGGVYGWASTALVPKHANRDKLAHCIAACVIRKCGTIVLSWLFGWVKELVWDRGHVDKGDLAANREGEKCAKDVKKVVDCDKCCRKKYPVPTPGMGRGPIF